jgi:molybdate transport system substrate-binding protein
MRVTLCLVLLLAACAPAPAPPRTLTVFAAASLKESFEELGARFSAAHPGVSVTFNFAGSQQLAQQLAQGAPADVFAAAGTREMGGAVRAGAVVSGTERAFATNRLAVIVPRDNPAGIVVFEDLARPGVRLVLAGPSVPAGAYALQAIDRLGPDLAARVQANVVSQEENVRAVVTKIALGEGDAGIVYFTDVTSDVKFVPIRNAFNVRAVYLLAPTAHPPAGAALAQAFVDFVWSPDGQAILARHGFGPPPSAFFGPLRGWGQGADRMRAP